MSIASRIQPDARPVLVVATVATAALALVSFLLSFNGLADAATWANVPAWLAWAIPAYVDGAILVYTLAALVFRARGESARLEWTALGVFAALSVAANGVHAWATAPAALQAALGVPLAALAPVSVVITTHTIARLVVAPPTPTEEATSVRQGQRHTYAMKDEVKEYPATAADAAPAIFASSSAHVWESDEEQPAPAPVAILTTADRNARIRELDAEGLSFRAIAAQVGCSKSTVSRILGRLPDEPAIAS